MVQRPHPMAILHPLACRSRSAANHGSSSFSWHNSEYCSFCVTHTETHEHLFFECQTSQTVWQTVNARANINWPCTSWQNLLQWASATYNKKTNVKHIIARLLLSTTVYQLWYECNNQVFSNQFQTAPTIAETVFQLVRMHITSMEFSSITQTNICDVWGIQQPNQYIVPACSVDN